MVQYINGAQQDVMLLQLLIFNDVCITRSLLALRYLFMVLDKLLILQLYMFMANYMISKSWSVKLNCCYGHINIEF